MEHKFCSFCKEVVSPGQCTDLKSVDEGLNCDFLAISFEVLNFQIHDGVCCDNCKDRLIDSYKFKSKAAQALQGFNYEIFTDIIKKVVVYLNNLESLDNFSVMECSTCLAIVSASDRLYMESQGWQDFFDSNSDLLVEMEEFDDQIVIKEEKMADSPFNGISFEPLTEEQDENVEDEESINDPEDKSADGFATTVEESQPAIRRKRGPRKKWLNNMLKNCKTSANTSKGKVDIWKCCFCNSTAFISLPGLKYHVQRAHAKALNDLQVKSEAVSTEVIKNASKRHGKDPDWIKQMVEQSKNQCLDIWRCSICNAVTSKTEFGMHIHIVRMHCERKASNNIPNAVEKHKHDPVWINEMSDKSQNKDGFWTCCLCNDVTTTKRLGIYFHIVRMHCKSRYECSSASSFKELQHETEDGEKHEKDPEWIRAMVESSNSDSTLGLWTCCICNVVSSSSALGIQLHIIRMHCKKQNFVPETAKTKKHERDPEWISEMIDNSRTSDGDFDMWNCCLCHNFMCATRLGIQLHIIRMHCDNRIFIPHQKTSLKDSSNVDIYDKSLNDESDKHEKDPQWITEMVESSKCDEDNAWTCCICSKVTSISALGIRFHIMRRHCKSRNTPSNDEEVKHERDPEWINEMIANSKTPDSDIWNCCLCQKFTCSSRIGIQLHIIRMHCDNRPFVPLQKTNNEENVDDGSEKHDREPEWIKEMVESSNSDSTLGLWTCCICNIVKSSSAHGIRLHIIRMHCKKQNFVSEATQRYEKDPEWINTMIESSKHSDDPDIWNCCICNKFTCASRLGIQLHIIRIHCVSLAGSKTPKNLSGNSSDDGSISEPEYNRNDLDIDYSNTDMKTKHLMRGKRWNNWVKKMAMKSERKLSNQNGSAWTCTICRTFRSHSYRGMKHHIAIMHRKGAFAKLNRFKNTTNTSKTIKSSQTSESIAGTSNASTISQHVGSKYECDTCSESYTSKSDLLIHLKKERNIVEEPASSQSTQVEQHKTFMSDTNKILELEPSNDVSIVCEICSIPFSARTLYKSHMNQHHCEPSGKLND